MSTKRKQVLDHSVDIDPWDFDELTPEAAAEVFLQYHRNSEELVISKGWEVRIAVKSDGFDHIEFLVEYWRPENDAEYKKRIAAQERAAQKRKAAQEKKKERARAILAQAEEEERAEYERLKAKYGN